MNLFEFLKQSAFTIIFVCYYLWNKPIDDAIKEYNKKNKLTPSQERLL